MRLSAPSAIQAAVCIVHLQPSRSKFPLHVLPERRLSPSPWTPGDLSRGRMSQDHTTFWGPDVYDQFCKTTMQIISLSFGTRHSLYSIHELNFQDFKHGPVLMSSILRWWPVRLVDPMPGFAPALGLPAPVPSTGS
ncbi:hypothetical protein SODALDRAFT_354389 [Sodiomyces alkalinus F11]|uniref:Uncharacterized protein n=1 Tax=Sodiomyces alkalinus (strain CBS 110278 / VKM F-3762 / F11) TaxID=1314773 RepID=A0A3N2Q679_SODAK|nr:hypothetical protein SODALDRAFT_354389 [Sodiomyces alkalinus F11]ROT42262.1 hypothetical protein SODALDRAFT_354389 [Sodiomyces alkalinus F11]